MEITLVIVFALFGAAIGSFLNVCIDRLPSGKSLVFPPSRCDYCQEPLSPKDLIPVVSYLWLRGRCRYCHRPISIRLMFVELGTGLLFAFLYYHYGLSIELAVTAFYGTVFIVIAVIDLDHGLILNKIVYPMIVVTLIIDALLPQPGIINGVIGGAVGFTFLLIPGLISRGGMGWGDIKMAALIGMVTGFPLVMVAMLTAVILGGLTAIVLLLLKIKKRKDAVPFGPFLSLATMATLIWGGQILHWYLGFFH